VTDVPVLRVSVAATDRALTEAVTPLVDAATLGQALEREAPILLAAARAITLDDAEAEDLVQATFEPAVRHVGHLREPGALRAWLLTIEALEAFRAVRRLRRLVRLDQRVTELPVGGPNADDSLAVRAALRQLSPRVRAAVVLHHMAGLSVAEAAAALGVTDNTVKTQLKIGMARLRAELDRD